jgi:hypothetical protein
VDGWFILLFSTVFLLLFFVVVVVVEVVKVGARSCLTVHPDSTDLKAWIDSGFMVRKEDGSTIMFDRSSRRDGPEGLYRANRSKQGLHGMMLVNTVESNFTTAEVTRAELARTFQKIVGRPSTKDPIRYVTRNQLPQLPHHQGRHNECGDHIWTRRKKPERKDS